MKKLLAKLINKPSTTASELKTLCDSIGLKVQYIGSIWNLKAIPEGNSIILLTPSTEVLSGHWVALNRVEYSCIEYFDSFGMPPPKEIEDLAFRLDRRDLDIFYNIKQVQSLNVAHCGIYAVMALKLGINNMIDKLHLKIQNTFMPVYEYDGGVTF